MLVSPVIEGEMALYVLAWDSDCYGLGGPGIESRWGGARFSASVQTGPGTHPASCTMGAGSLSWG